MKIYTKTGDDGTTSLFSGGRVRKDDLRVEAYGTVDELNSHLGMARAIKPAAEVDALLETVQNQLFRLGADLATQLDAKADWVVRVDEAAVRGLETDIDRMTDILEPLKNFILPGGTPAAAQIHIARTVCRRAERLAVHLAEREPITELTVQYLNRLSDWLFTLARYENHLANMPESRWSVRN
jgi:cob(I)alamin adenosyltransferase